MAQFDSLIIFPLLWSLLLSLILHYNIVIMSIIPNFFSVKKFREKNLNSHLFYKFFNLTQDIKLHNSYTRIF